MSKLSLVAGMLFALVLMSGCAVDLKLGKQFPGDFPAAPQGKAVVYMLRTEGMMNGAQPYIFVNVSAPDDKGEPAAPYSLAATVGKDMFVPVVMDPGTYLFNAVAKKILTIKPDEVRCLEVGSRFRGVTVFIADELEREECRKTLMGRDEGVQASEALERMGKNKDSFRVYKAK